MINFDDYANENKTKYNLKCRYIQDHPYRILTIGGSGSGIIKALLNLNNQPNLDKIYLYAKDPCEAKYQFLINKRESTGLKHFHNLKAFIVYSNNMQDVFKNIEEYNIGKTRKILIVFDKKVFDNKKLMKNQNMILIEKLPKCQPYYQAKLRIINIKYLIDGEILPSRQGQMKEQAKFTYSPLEKAFEKRIKTIEDFFFYLGFLS